METMMKTEAELQQHSDQKILVLFNTTHLKSGFHQSNYWIGVIFITTLDVYIQERFGA